MFPTSTEYCHIKDIWVLQDRELWGGGKKSLEDSKTSAKKRVGVSHRPFLGFILFYLHSFLNFNSSERYNLKKL